MKGNTTKQTLVRQITRRGGERHWLNLRQRFLNLRETNAYLSVERTFVKRDRLKRIRCCQKNSTRFLRGGNLE